MSLTDVTTTPIRPVGSRRTRAAWTMTPSRSSASTSARPTPSRPTAQMSWTRVPSRPSQRAALAAEPPWRSITRPDTSVPRTIVCDGVRTASSIRSPRTTTEGPFDRRPAIGPRRSRRAIPVARRGPRDVDGDAEGRSAIGTSITAEGRGPLVGWPHPGAPNLITAPPARSASPSGVPAMTVVAETLDLLAIDTIRTLSIDGVQKANSGHPGAPMGAAPMAYTLWTRFLRHAPHDPKWPDRDRFVLCAGHASMLLYSLLHLTGYDLPLDHLEQFRQWGCRTPGHPEYGAHRRGRSDDRPARTGLRQRRRHGHRRAPARRRVQPRRATTSSTTGRTGSAPTATSRRASRPRRRAWPATCGWASSCSSTTTTTSSSTARPRWPGARMSSPRFDAYGWHTQRVADGNDIAAIAAAIERAPSRRRPSLIAVRTHIGFGSPNKQDSQKAHGAPLGPDEVRLTKLAYGWDPDKTVLRPGRGPSGVRWRAVAGAARRSSPTGRNGWSATPRTSRPRPGSCAAGWPASCREDWDAGLMTYAVGEDFATRQVSQAAIQALAGPVPELFGGAADLSESNLTDVKGAGDFTRRRGRAATCASASASTRMGGVANGIAYHGGFIPYVATFLTFSDYMRGSVRLASLVRDPRHLRLDPRLDRPGRGRPDPPAGRALRGAAGDPQPVVHPARRRQRGVGRVAGRRGARADGPGGARPDAPEAADARRDGRHGARGRRAAAATSLREAPSGGDGRDARSSSRPAPSWGWRWRRRARSKREGIAHARRVPALLGGCSTLQDQSLPRRGPAARRPARGSRSRPASRWAGSAGRATRARSCRSSTSARRRREARSSSTSGSPWTT